MTSLAAHDIAGKPENGHGTVPRRLAERQRSGEAGQQFSPDVTGERGKLLLKTGMDMDKQSAGTWRNGAVAD